ncbi:DUF488 family protein [Oenococcus sicerae]|uniref:DUF488 family protein n=1 Tax=Oenococcus sicerae TaxID=2203724 RepID=A0AAJ1VQN5_9LACO|nr:DUF488 family protein [Oenococcus sicerae]MDN6900397.1 DUF488 family protein [Oenococcus sicerae]QAS69974.1 DUF488 family protein [Oenococcus sicerae]VDK14920.1 hypothetical protein OAL24_01656 [Oenococcus sicerae]
MIKFERIYATESKGYRVLIDRLWPRGISKEKAAIDLWAKDIAPSTELRQKFHDQEIDDMAFRALYLTELASNPATAGFLQTLKAHVDSVLLYSAKDDHENNAKVLADYLKRQGIDFKQQQAQGANENNQKTEA